jgi:hypothetical protein
MLVEAQIPDLPAVCVSCLLSRLMMSAVGRRRMKGCDVEVE